MIDMKLPTFRLKGPLRHRPFKGGIVGGVTGLLFGLLAASAFPIDRMGWFLGYSTGGLAAGAIMGSLLPAFRQRVMAGLSVALGAMGGFFVAMSFWPDPWTPELVIFCGAAAGFVYAVLFWDYEPPSDSRG
jgi:hypothetical protein